MVRPIDSHQIVAVFSMLEVQWRCYYVAIQVVRVKTRRALIVVRFKRINQFGEEEIAKAACEEDKEDLGSGIRRLHRLVANHGIC